MCFSPYQKGQTIRRTLKHPYYKYCERIRASFPIGMVHLAPHMPNLVNDVRQIRGSYLCCLMCISLPYLHPKTLTLYLLYATLIFNARLASLQGALDAIEAVKTGVEQHSRMAEKTALQFFSSIRAAVDSREKAVLKVPQHTLRGKKNRTETCREVPTEIVETCSHHLFMKSWTMRQIFCRNCEGIGQEKLETWTHSWKNWNKR